MMIAAAAVLAVVAVGGCASEVVGKASAAPTTAPPTTAYRAPTTYAVPTTPALAGVDQVYVSTVRGGTGITEATYSDNNLLTVARLVCQVLVDSETRIGTRPGAGEMIGTIQGVAQVAGFSNWNAGFVTGAAITARCPQYGYLIPN